MKFMTLVHGRENQTPPPPEAYAEMEELINRLSAAGKLVTAGGLMPGSQSATIEQRGGKVIVSNGPFAETTELVGGYSIIEADSLEEAVELCRETVALTLKYSPDWEGYTEIRPIYG